MYYKANYDRQLKENEPGAGRKNFVFSDNISNDDFVVMQDNSSIKVRFLPPWSSDGIFFKKVYIHWGVGEKKYSFCALNDPAKSPFMQVVKELYAIPNKGWKNYKEDLELVRPRASFYAQVLIYPQLDKVFLIRLGTKLVEQIFQLVKTGDYGDITDPEEGTDFTINITGGSLNRVYTAVPNRQTSSILGNPGLDKLFNLDKIVVQPSLEMVGTCFSELKFSKYVPSASVKNILEKYYNNVNINVNMNTESPAIIDENLNKEDLGKIETVEKSFPQESVSDLDLAAKIGAAKQRLFGNSK